jgi:CubicO group peptidase (beta-lactamase class C family)
MLAATMLAVCALAGAADTPPVPDAAASDPVSLGWMQGTPPPPAKVLRKDDASFYRFPQSRWSFSHWRELFPTANVSRGDGPVAPLPKGNPADLDALTFTRTTGGEPMTFAAALPALYTDGIVVLHRGRIVYEKYFGALDDRRPHIAFSVTKSFFGTLGAMLVAEGALDENAPVSRYIPELTDSAFGDATVRQVLDMTTAIDYSEVYGDPKSSFVQYARAVGLFPYPPGATGPDDVYSYLRTLRKSGTHGERFTYRSPNTDVVGWLVARATGKRPEVVLQERLWNRLGAEADAFMALDRAGNATAAGGFNLRLRDLARFGEMMRLGGKLDGRQVVPAAVVGRIRQGADREAFAEAGFDTLTGWSYRDQWWISHDDHGVFMARGIHGQAIYVDPQAEMVIARFSSHPVASTVTFDPIVLPAYRAVAKHLMGRSR